MQVFEAKEKSLLFDEVVVRVDQLAGVPVAVGLVLQQLGVVDPLQHDAAAAVEVAPMPSLRGKVEVVGERCNSR